MSAKDRRAAQEHFSATPVRVSHGQEVRFVSFGAAAHLLRAEGAPFGNVVFTDQMAHVSGVRLSHAAYLRAVSYWLRSGGGASGRIRYMLGPLPSELAEVEKAVRAHRKSLDPGE